MGEPQRDTPSQSVPLDKTRPDPKVVAPKLVFLTEAYVPRNQDGSQATDGKPGAPESGKT